MHDADKVTRGRAITDKLAKILGPAQVGNYVEPRRPVTEAQQASSEQIRTGYRRVVAPDGTVRLERA
ncbi:hypothetical protein ATL41_0137 [Flavimobilis soli]|jgi:hypothetical protein|uniref:Uncharacterized protein n=1 Tax=Flavimobilis soli TaxID=442709 RepID=A0A2A9E8S6_9MICO|nr:hypothetical protein [Flavimobilis soli]PFG35457.1 hypothetical protein ATL41_0137 [Flavimobilis soli]